MPVRIGRARAEKLLKIQQKISLAHNQALIGSEQTVIIDSVTGKGKAEGRTLLDAPDIDNIVHIKFKGKLQPGDLAAVRIESAGEYELESTLIRKEAK